MDSQLATSPNTTKTILAGEVYKDVITSEVLYYLHLILSSCLATIVASFGLVANVCNSLVFVGLGFKESINISLMALSVADLAVSVTSLVDSVSRNSFFLRPDVVRFSEPAVMYLIGWQNICFSRMSSSLTLFITFERCLCITIPLKVKRVVTTRVTWAVVFSICVIFLFMLVPNYFEVSFDLEVNGFNRTYLTINFLHGTEAAGLICLVVNLSAQLPAYFLMPMFTIFLIRGLYRQSKLRAEVLAKPSQHETLVSSKDQKVVKMVTLVAIIFIVTSFPGIVMTLLQLTVSEMTLNGPLGNSWNAGWTIAMLFSVLNSSVNIFVYYNMSSSYKQTFGKIFKRPEDMD